MSKLLTRDEEFTEFVVARRDHLRRTAYLLCGDLDTAEDLVQTTLTKLYLRWGRFRDLEAPHAYARRVLVTSHIDLTRRSWWSRERLFGDAAPDAVAPEEFPLEERSELTDALRLLPPAMRRVVVLRHLWGLSITETADLLGVTEGTVKSQSAKALSRLSQLIESHDKARELTP